jgi:AbrB family looped-hinge helix DNA binding protein
MSIATVTSKGQITIPAEIRERYGITSGSRVRFVPIDDHTIEFVAMTGSIMALAGMFKSDDPPMSIEEMDDAIGEYLGEKHRR